MGGRGRLVLMIGAGVLALALIGILVLDRGGQEGQPSLMENGGFEAAPPGDTLPDLADPPADEAGDALQAPGLDDAPATPVD